MRFAERRRLSMGRSWGESLAAPALITSRRPMHRSAIIAPATPDGIPPDGNLSQLPTYRLLPIGIGGAGFGETGSANSSVRRSIGDAPARAVPMEPPPLRR